MPVAIGQHSITLLRDGSSSEDQYAANTSLTVAPVSGWSSAVPLPQTGSYVWKRSRAVHADGTYGPWGSAVRITGAIGQPGAPGEAGPAGPAGPPGNPGQLGIYAEGTTLHVKGYAEDGTLSASQGYIHKGMARITVGAYAETLGNAGQGYVIWNGSSVRFAKMAPNGSTLEWKDYETSAPIAEPVYILGRFRKEGSVVFDIHAMEPVDPRVFAKAHFMDVLANEGWQDIQAWADALGVTQVFENLAVWNLFANKFMGNFLEVRKAIYAGYSYSESGQLVPPADGAGFWLGASGLLRAMNAQLTGTLRTGTDAPDSARVGIRDQSGILGGVAFSGTGPNDMMIASEGAVPGNFTVEIDGTEDRAESFDIMPLPSDFSSMTITGCVRHPGGKRIFAASNNSGVHVVDDSMGGYVNVMSATKVAGGGSQSLSGLYYHAVERCHGASAYPDRVLVGGVRNLVYTDDGSAWYYVDLGTCGFDHGEAVTAICCAPSSAPTANIIVVGTNAMRMFYSLDGGITWTHGHGTIQAGGQVYSIAIAPASSIHPYRFVASTDGDFRHSADGKSWTVAAGNISSSNLRVIRALPSGWFVGTGSRHYHRRSQDGLTWTAASNDPTPHTLYDDARVLEVNPAGRVFSVDVSGRIAWSDDGDTWNLLPSATTNSAKCGHPGAQGEFCFIAWEGSLSVPRLFTSIPNDTFRWRENSGPWHEKICIEYGVNHALQGYHISITFLGVNGHAPGDTWTFSQGAMHGLVITDSSGNAYLVASSGIINIRTLLPLVDSTSSATIGGTDLGSTSKRIRNIVGAGTVTGFSEVSADTVNATAVYGARFN